MRIRSHARKTVRSSSRRATGPVLAALVLALLPAVALTAETAELKVVNKTFDPETGELSYELWNDSPQVITAWRLSLAAGDSLGRAYGSQMDQDFYPSYDGAARLEQTLAAVVAQGPLHPDQRLAATWRLDFEDDSGAFPALSVRAVAWVFADATHGGSGEAAASLLESRAVRLEEIAALRDELLAAEPGLRSPAERGAWVAEKAERLRQSATVSPEEGMPAPAAAVLSATRIDLAEWVEATEQAAGAEPVRAAEIFAELESDLDRELRIGRAQLGPGAQN